MNYEYIVYNPYTREILLEGRVEPKEAYIEETWMYGTPEDSYLLINHIPKDSSFVISDADGDIVASFNAAPESRNASFTTIILDGK